MIKPEHYKHAVQTQGACNSSGLIESLYTVIKEIRAEARALGKGTDWINEHPIIRLYVEQLSHLSRKRDWSEAMTICEKMAAGEVVDVDRKAEANNEIVNLGEVNTCQSLKS